MGPRDPCLCPLMAKLDQCPKDSGLEQKGCCHQVTTPGTAVTGDGPRNWGQLCALKSRGCVAQKDNLHISTGTRSAQTRCLELQLQLTACCLLKGPVCCLLRLSCDCPQRRLGLQPEAPVTVSSMSSLLIRGSSPCSAAPILLGGHRNGADEEQEQAGDSALWETAPRRL